MAPMGIMGPPGHPIPVHHFHPGGGLKVTLLLNQSGTHATKKSSHPLVVSFITHILSTSVVVLN